MGEAKIWAHPAPPGNVPSDLAPPSAQRFAAEVTAALPPRVPTGPQLPDISRERSGNQLSSERLNLPEDVHSADLRREKRLGRILTW